MPISSDQVSALHEIANAVLSEGRFQNFVAQSHSRDILRQLQTPHEEWPAYTPELDDDLVYAAQTLLYVGLRLKLESGTDSGDQYLTQGAEILEYVYSRTEESDPERVCQLFTAALAYYMAGHFARAFVLVRDLESDAPLPRFLRPLRHLLLKEHRLLRRDVLDQLLETEYADESIASAVASGELDEDAALCLVLEATLFRSLSHYLEYVRTGTPELLATAEDLLTSGADVAIHHRFADWWWYYSCVRVMLQTFDRHSLWNNLAPFLSRPETADLTRQYIRANLRLPIPLTELWPSQVSAVPRLFAADLPNLCIRMPTSAGKTKIAELAILAQLSQGFPGPNLKCVYIAPFRSLAIEVEQTLRLALRSLGVRVSELYGGFEFTAADRLLIESTDVLVATPEKLDAFLRTTPELASQIRLVIVDEGHIISPPNLHSLREARGLKYEVFLQRLVTRCQRNGSRIVFLSAVMPNAEQFAEWITGGQEGLIASDWRPSRLLLGEAVWTGQGVDLEYTHSDRKPLGHKCFVRSFISSLPATDVPVPKRKHALPKDDNEAIALTALELARHKLTMVFVAQKRSTEPLGRTILTCIAARRAVAAQAGEAYALPVASEHETAREHCLSLVREHMGSDSVHVRFLEEGFVIHHSSLPQPVRIAVERLVRAGAIRLVVATTTLAQGVNFPIHTVLVHSLNQGHDAPVSAMDFWNICGRAGRGMKENEGQVLFFAKQCFNEWNKGKCESPKFARQPLQWRQNKWREWCREQRAAREVYITQYGNYQVQSGLLHLLIQVKELWTARHGNLDIPALCEALANHQLELFVPNEHVDLEIVLSTLDGLLLAITEECDAEEITPDTFQSLLARSLVHLQLATPEQRTFVNEAFAARVQYIRRRHPDRSKRLQFYQLGLPLRDCEFLESSRDELLRLFQKASEYEHWTLAERAMHIADISEYLFRLNELAPDTVPDAHRRILELWLSGATPAGILADTEVKESQLTQDKLNKWVDQTFGFRLPWGLNSVGCYLRQHAEAVGEPWPEACDYYSAFVKYGVYELVVCWLLGLGIGSRAVASRIGGLIGSKFQSPDALLNWLRAGGFDQLIALGMNDEDTALLREVLPTSSGVHQRSDTPFTIRLQRPANARMELAAGTPLLIEPLTDIGHYRLHTLSGEVVCNFHFQSNHLAELMATPEFVTAAVVEGTSRATGGYFTVQINTL